MTESQVALLADARLSDAARILGLHLSMLGDGEHELSHDALSTLLHGCPNRDTVGRHLRQLVVFGYAVKTSAGGKGSPRYRFSAREKTRAEDVLPAKKHAQSLPVVVEGSSSIPPIVPPVASIGPLEEDAAKLVEAERDSTLGPAAKPLVSYLRRRVPPDRQEPYVGRVLGALDKDCMNPQWRDATGAVIPMPRRRAIMADALNELGTASEATDRKWAPGDWGNLRNKLLGLIRAENEPRTERSTGTDGQSRGPPRGRGKAPIEDQDYTPTKTFEGFRR